MITAFNLIARFAPDFGGVCTVDSDSSAILELPIRLVDGRVLQYRLRLRRSDESVYVQEEQPTHLPSFCPERHINYDGTFCLYYPAASRLTVTDEVSAIAWLETLYRYLKLQERARVQRKWPNNEVWAHGNAAHHQIRASTAATALNGEFSAALEQNQIALQRRRSKGRAILEIRVRGVHAYSVWESYRRVINLKQRCFCRASGLRRPKTLRRCGLHAKQAVELAFALRDWQSEEDRYWQSMQDRNCCGSCDNCPLSPSP